MDLGSWILNLESYFSDSRLMVDDKLVWDQHMDYISSKIIRGIGILKRIRHFIPRDSLLLNYHTLIEPYFRYCSIVWGQCGETLKDKLQTLQNRAARTIAKLRYDEANHYELLTEFGWLSVRNLIILDIAVFVYNEINNLHPEQADNPFQRLDCLHSYSTRSVSNNNLFIPRGKTNNFQKTMAFAGSKIWNKIPKEIGMAQTLHSFKEHLKKHLAEQQARSSLLTDSLSLQRCGGPSSPGLGRACDQTYFIKLSLVLAISNLLYNLEGIARTRLRLMKDV